MKDIVTKYRSTNFLRASLVALGIIALLLCATLLPSFFRGDWIQEYPEISYLRYPIFVALSATAIPFFIALFQAFKLLKYIDTNKAFSKLSVKALKNIKYCTAAFGLLYTTCMPLIYHEAQREDAPGMILIFGAIFIGIPVVISVFVAVLQKLLQSAIDIKSENDLTV